MATRVARNNPEYGEVVVSKLSSAPSAPNQTSRHRPFYTTGKKRDKRVAAATQATLNPLLPRAFTPSPCPQPATSPPQFATAVYPDHTARACSLVPRLSPFSFWVWQVKTA